MARTARAACFVVATLVLGALSSQASAQGAGPTGPAAPPSPAASAPPGKPAGQGIAVLAVGPVRDEAFALARAIYGSRLRPTSLDEVRARVLAGAPPPANASRELRELAEVRAAITGEDAAGRRLLTGLAQQVGAQALLVVRVEGSGAPKAPASAPATIGPLAPAPDSGASPDGGAPAAPAEPPSATGNVPATPAVVARLFLTDSGDFDAARYGPEPGLEGAAAWRATITSLESRFPPVSRAVGPSAATAPGPVKLRPEDEKTSPFYASGWFWGAVGGAALIGAAFYFVSRDTSSDPIHLQMRVPK
jgi:hypothetical protein